MNKYLKALLIFLSILLLLGSIAALLFWNNWRQNIIPVAEDIQILTDKPNMGTPIKIKMLIKTPWYRQILEPISLQGNKNVEIIGTSTLTPKSIDLKALYWELETEIIAFDSGKYENLLLTTNLSPDQEGKAGTLSIELPLIEVIPREINKNTSIATHKNLDSSIFAEGPLPEPTPPTWPWILGAICLILLFIYIFFRKQKQASLKVISAWEEAEKALIALKSNALINDELFFVTLSDILRLYIEKRFRLPATEKTSEEFIAQVRNDSMLSEDHKFSLEKFMTTADMVKFAKMSADNQQKQECLSMAGNFVRETIPQVTEEPKNV